MRDLNIHVNVNCAPHRVLDYLRMSEIPMAVDDVWAWTVLKDYTQKVYTCHRSFFMQRLLKRAP